MDTGLSCLTAIARFHQLPAEPDQLAHEFVEPGATFTNTEILLAAKALTLKAKVLSLSVDQIDNAFLPAIASARDGTFFILARVQSADESNPTEDSHKQVLIHDMRQQAPKLVSLETFDELWTGEIIALIRREGWGAAFQKKFDISWFIPSLIKYRKLFLEVVVVSFFLQLFALMTPLFFQVVMDKVLVHRGFTTLDVLAVGFFVVVSFDVILGGIRNYTFSHTTNRVDVELGSRLYNHLMGLPLSYNSSHVTNR